MAANKNKADKTKNTASGRKKTSSKTSSKGAKTASRTKASAVPKRSSGLSPRVRAILYAAVAAVFVCIIFIKGSNVWTMIRSFFFGVLGFGIFLVPVTLFYLCVMTEKEKQVARYKLKLFLCVVIILFIGALIYAGSGAKYSDMNFFACLGNLFKDASDTSRYMTFDCGIIGGLLGYPLVVLFGSTAALFTSFVVTAALILIVANISIKDMTAAASRTAVHIREAGEERARVRRERREENRERKLAERGDIDIALEGENRKSSGSFIDIPLDDKKTKVKKAKSAVNGIDTDIADSKEENAADKDLSQDLINIINRASKPMGKSADNTVSAIAEDISNEKSASKAEQTEVKPDAETENIVKKALLKSKKDNSEEAGDEIAEQLDRAVRSDNSQKEEKKYQFPPIQLLKPKLNSDDSDAMEEMQNNAKKLIDTLTSFGVKASIVNICRGPSVTRYELQPAPGVKISKITNLSDDIALSLAANGVRIEAPIPGKAAVGIEVPNKVVSMVTMRELIDSDKFRNSKSKLTTVLGRDISGEIVVTDLAKMPHLLIAGTTGSGKSVCVNSILMSILYKATPDEVKLLLIDPKMVEFSKYKFDADTIRSMFDNFSFNNARPITKAMIAWWAYQNDKQPLLSLETNFEIEHIYARNRNEKENSLTDARNVESLGNKALLEKRINIRASDYRFADKKKYYEGFTNSKGQVKEGTGVIELLDLTATSTDFTEKDIIDRYKQMINCFINYLQKNGLLK